MFFIFTSISNKRARGLLFKIKKKLKTEKKNCAFHTILNNFNTFNLKKLILKSVLKIDIIMNSIIRFLQKSTQNAKWRKIE